MKTAYEILGISRDASRDDVSQVYIDYFLGKLTDPGPVNDPTLYIRRFYLAYWVLADADRRARYDSGELDINFSMSEVDMEDEFLVSDCAHLIQEYQVKASELPKRNEHGVRGALRNFVRRVAPGSR